MRLQIIGLVIATQTLMPSNGEAFANDRSKKAEKSAKKYTSKREWFSINHPEASNPFVKKFTIYEKSESGQADYDLVSFDITDFGEVYIASVRKIPQAVQDQMNQEEPKTTLSNLAHKAVFDWRQDLANEPEVVDDSHFETHLGKGLLRVYLAKEGSLLLKMQGNSEPKAYDTLISVLLVKLPDRFVYAIAENDFKAMDKAALIKNIKTFFASLELGRD